MKEVLLSDIVAFFSADIVEVKGNISNKRIRYLKPVGQEDEFTLDWVNPANKAGQQFAEHSRAKVIVCNSAIEYNDALQKADKVLVVSKTPKLLLAKIYQHYFKTLPVPQISDKADISPEAVIGTNCYIGAFSSVGKCKIGNNVAIMPNVTIYDDVEIGDNVMVHSGTILGRPGFGYERDTDNALYLFPQISRLIIKDNVEIGANCTIDKGALLDTVIERDSKINNSCHIAHNVSIGKSSVITGHVYIAGSTKIGNNVWISPNTTFIGHTAIGDNSIIGAGSVVTKDIPANEIWYGSPAKKQRDNEKRQN